jgi:hypothetical protein
VFLLFLYVFVFRHGHTCVFPQFAFTLVLAFSFICYHKEFVP